MKTKRFSTEVTAEQIRGRKLHPVWAIGGVVAGVETEFGDFMPIDRFTKEAKEELATRPEMRRKDRMTHIRGDKCECGEDYWESVSGLGDGHWESGTQYYRCQNCGRIAYTDREYETVPKEFDPNFLQELQSL